MANQKLISENSAPRPLRLPCRARARAQGSLGGLFIAGGGVLMGGGRWRAALPVERGKHARTSTRKHRYSTEVSYCFSSFSSLVLSCISRWPRELVSPLPPAIWHDRVKLACPGPAQSRAHRFQILLEWQMSCPHVPFMPMGRAMRHWWSGAREGKTAMATPWTVV